MKVGLGSNLTLEATINPDFGQIEADPAEVNLTVFETIFDERRPFFIEGNNVLEAGTSNYYYSRRIGARPTGPATGDFVDYPSTSTILGAAKLTGRLGSGTSLGFLGAVTGGELANTFESGGIRRPCRSRRRTPWSVGRVIQELGRDSTVGAHLTLVHRDLAAGDPLAAMLMRNAITAGADTRVRFQNRTYEAAFNVGLTYIDGEPAAIERVQRASGHYLQRLDQPTIRLDPTRRSLDGLQITRQLQQDRRPPLAVGRQPHDRVAGVRPARLRPAELCRRLRAEPAHHVPRDASRPALPRVLVRRQREQLLVLRRRPRRAATRSAAAATSRFRNFWSTSFNVSQYFRGQDAQLTRGGPAMDTPLGSNVIGVAAQQQGRHDPLERQRQPSHERVRGSRAGPSTAPSARALAVAAVLGRAGVHRRERAPASFSGPINRQYLTTLPGGRRGDLRPPLHLRLRRPHDAVDAVPRQLHLQAGRDARRVRGAVRGQRSLQRASASWRCRGAATCGSTAPTGRRSSRAPDGS